MKFKWIGHKTLLHRVLTISEADINQTLSRGCMDVKLVNAAFRLACYLLHWGWYFVHLRKRRMTLRDVAQASWVANKSISLPLCPKQQISNSWILFNSVGIVLCDESIVAVLQNFNYETASSVHREKQQSSKLLRKQPYSMSSMKLAHPMWKIFLKFYIHKDLAME